MRRTASRKQGHRAAFGIEEQLLTCRYQQWIVIFGELTSRRKDKWHLVVVSQRVDVGNGEDIFARQALHAAMTRVEYRQGTIGEGPHHIIVRARVLHTRAGVDHRISTAIHLLRRQSGAQRIRHPEILLAVLDIRPLFVIGKQQKIGLPVAMDGCEVVIMLDFTQYCLGFFHCRHRDSTDAQIHHAFAVGAFVVVHQTEVVVGAKAQLIFRFVQGLIARHEVMSYAFDVSEIERGPAKQGKIFEVTPTTKIHHTHEVSDASGVGHARRELIVNLVDVNDDTMQSVQRGMIIGQSLSLLPEDRRGQYQHVSLSNGMDILVGDTLPMLHFEGCRRME